MRIIANSKRSTKEVMCKECGTVFECSITDNFEKTSCKIGKGISIHYVINCPVCNEKVLLGDDLNEIFPWVIQYKGEQF